MSEAIVLRRGAWMGWLRAGLSAGVGLALCYLLARQVDWGALWWSLQTVRLGWVAAALASVAATVWVRAMRWRVLLAPRQPSADPWRLARLIALGQALNALVLVRTGEAARAYLVAADDAPGKFFALGTIGAEKLLDLIFWLVLSAMLLVWLPLPGWALTGGGALLAALVGLLAALALARLFLWSSLAGLARRSPVWAAVIGWLEALWGGFTVLRQAGVLWSALLWSAVLWAVYLFNNAAVFQALGMSQGLLAAMFVLAVLQAGTAPPSAPAKIGVFEYLCVLTLGALDVGADQSLAYGVVLHAVVLLPPVLWAALPVGPRS